MGGHLVLESEVGKGSLFRIELPLREANPADIVKPRETLQGDVMGLVAGQPLYRVLIVEDQLENQLLLTQLMEAIGIQVKIARDGQQGVQLFQDWLPDLIWMDRRMPVMNGMEAAKAIRQLPGGQDVKIIAVTASAFMEQRDEMLNSGMDDFVRKPYRANEIYDCLAKHLNVEYTYDGVSQSETSTDTLTPEMLVKLPDILRKELRDALKSLEEERIAHAIKQVAAYDQTLQKTLMRLVDNFDYPAIIRVLE
jgi:CheY-like chemotaxis protein